MVADGQVEAALGLLAGLGPDDDAAELADAGRLLVELRRPVEAERLLRAALGAEPDRAAAWDDLGRACNNLGRRAEAEACFRRALALAPGEARFHDHLGHVLRALDRLDEAEAAFRAAIARDPAHGPAWRNLGLAQLAREDPAAAATLVEAAHRLPTDGAVRSQLGVALQRAGHVAEAEVAHREATRLAPGRPDTWANLAVFLCDAGRREEGIEAYRRALAISPRDLGVQNQLADALLAAGRAHESLELARATLVQDAGNPAAIAVRAAALQALGRGAEAAGLLAMDAVVRRVPLAAPPGFASVAEFNVALADFVAAHPSLRFEPAGHATRQGGHTRELLSARDPGPAAALAARVAEAAVAYREGLELPPDHPFPGRVPVSPSLVMWAVVMQESGHQLPHIHPAAWLSGVYYPRLPRTVSAAGAGHDGWIEFGRPPAELAGATEPEVRLFRPEEGVLFLFPSYLYHRTLPFPGREPRISVAFDVLRAG
jgi:tetratricopeptide (TPR) repeat protein